MNGGRKQKKKKRWEDNIWERTGLEFAKSQRAVETREKWRQLIVKSSVVPQRPPRLRDRWRKVPIGLVNSTEKRPFCLPVWWIAQKKDRFVYPSGELHRERTALSTRLVNCTEKGPLCLPVWWIAEREREREKKNCFTKVHQLPFYIQALPSSQLFYTLLFCFIARIEINMFFL